MWEKDHRRHCHTGRDQDRQQPQMHDALFKSNLLSSSFFEKVESEVAICSSSSTSCRSFPDCKVRGILDLSWNFRIATLAAFEAKQANAGMSICREPALWSPLTLLQMVCAQDDNDGMGIAIVVAWSENPSSGRCMQWYVCHFFQNHMIGWGSLRVGGLTRPNSQVGGLIQG